MSTLEVFMGSDELSDPNLPSYLPRSPCYDEASLRMDKASLETWSATSASDLEILANLLPRLNEKYIQLFKNEHLLPFHCYNTTATLPNLEQVTTFFKNTLDFSVKHRDTPPGQKNYLISSGREWQCAWYRGLFIQMKTNAFSLALLHQLLAASNSLILPRAPPGPMRQCCPAAYAKFPLVPWQWAWTYVLKSYTYPPKSSSLKTSTNY